MIIKNKLYILSTIVLVSILAIIFADTFSSFENKEIKRHHEIDRIISLSPSITETLFAIGLGDKVVGRTRFCKYPSETSKITEVGGYIDPNYEAILSLTPDLVILLPEHERVKSYLKKLKIPFLEVNNKTVSDILNSIKIIGDSCSAKAKADSLLRKINTTITKIKEKTQKLPKLKTIISIGRTMGTGTLKDVYIAGGNTYFNELIEFAGGINAFNNKDIAYPMLSAEGIIHLNPDVIIDLVADMKTNNLTKTKVLKEWESIGSVNAVKNNNVAILDSDYIVIPGPRFVLLLKDLAKIIHPEIKWTF